MPASPNCPTEPQSTPHPKLSSRPEQRRLPPLRSGGIVAQHLRYPRNPLSASFVGQPLCHPDPAVRDPTFSSAPHSGASGREAEGSWHPLAFCEQQIPPSARDDIELRFLPASVAPQIEKTLLKFQRGTLLIAATHRFPPQGRIASPPRRFDPARRCMRPLRPARCRVD